VAFLSLALMPLSIRAQEVVDDGDPAGSPPVAPLPVWERYPDDDVVLISRELAYTLDDAGAVSLRVSVVYQAASEKGRESLQSRTIEYNAALQQVEVERACSVDDAGVERCTPTDRMVEQPEAGEDIVAGQNQPMQIVVPFEEVRLGSRTELTYRRDYPTREGQRLFSAIRGRSSTGPCEHVAVSVTHPAGRPVHASLVGEAEYSRVDEGDAVTHRWSFGPQPSPPTDSDRPKMMELGPALYLSEIADWQAFTDWYMPYVEAAAERYRTGAGREVMALAEPRMAPLDPALKLGFLMDDRMPVASVDVSVGTLLPGPLQTVVRQAPTQVEKSIALWALLRDAGIEGVNLAFATRRRVGVPGDIACPPAFQDLLVHVAGRGVIDGDTHADFIDTVPSSMRGGTVVVLDPAGPRVLSGDDLDPPGDRPGWHRDGRITVSGDEVRVDEELTFSGSAAAGARSFWRRKQDDLELEKAIDRRANRWLAARLRKPRSEEDSSLRDEIHDWTRARDYTGGKVREVELFDAWDPDAELTMHLRYAPTETCVEHRKSGSCAVGLLMLEPVADLLMVRLPLTVEGVSSRCAAGRPERDAPLAISAWNYSYRYDFVVPVGYELVGVPEDIAIESDLASLSLSFREAEIPPVQPDDDDKKADDDEEPEEPRPGVVVEASYQIHVLRVPEDRYQEFRQIAARHALAFTDPIVLRRTSAP
jgi:hypothetical protein